MENGRCYLHGGRVPKGNAWHVRQWPDRASPNADKKLAAKLEKAERDAHRRRLRRAVMTPEQRAAHEHWHATHAPGPGGMRAARRAQRAAAADLSGLMARSDPAPTAEQREIAEALNSTRVKLAIIRSQADGGIFS